MFCLLHEVHFWTQKDGVSVDNLDFGAFMYGDKKNQSQCPFFDGKKSYAEGRGIVWSLSNKRPKKLKDSLKEFEELLFTNRILNVTWRNSTSIQIIFGNGLVSYIQVNPNTGDLEEFNYDKYMIGKLVSHYVTDVLLSLSHAVFVYTDNQITVSYFTKPALKLGTLKKWSTLDIKICNEILSGPSGRRLEKQLTINAPGDLIAVWWKSGNDEVYPWSPIVKDEDRANIHVYSLNGSKIELSCYYRTEYEPITVQFSITQPNVIFIFQQRISKKSEVFIEWLTSEVNCMQFETIYALSIPIPTHSCAISLSPKEDKLFVACIDGSLLISDSYGNVMNTIKATFIPTLSCWHPDGCLLLIANERGQLQWFDSYLSCVRCQFLSEDLSPSAVLDIGSFFKYQPTLLSMKWNRRPNDNNLNSSHDDLLMLHFERGPIVMLKLITSGGFKKLSSDVVISQYLKEQNATAAVNLLFTLDWEQEGEMALASLQLIVSNQLKHHLTPEREAILEKALGSYHNPVRPIPQSAQTEYADSIHDLTRRFFHHLLRYQIFEKAFRLAIDLDDYDLFMDIHNYCKKIGNTNMATAALERAEEILYSSESESSSCECSDSECSCFSEGTDSSMSLAKTKKIPPLPLLCTPRPAPRNQIKYSQRVSHSIKYQTQPQVEISPNAVGIPTFDYDPLLLGNLRKQKLNDQLYSTSFINDIKESLPPQEKALKPEIKQIADSESGKIKVVHFGLV